MGTRGAGRQTTCSAIIDITFNLPGNSTEIDVCYIRAIPKRSPDGSVLGLVSKPCQIDWNHGNTVRWFRRNDAAR